MADHLIPKPDLYFAAPLVKELDEQQLRDACAALRRRLVGVLDLAEAYADTPFALHSRTQQLAAAEGIRTAIRFFDEAMAGTAPAW